MQTYIILGVVASIVLEIIKGFTDLNSWKSKLAIVAISLATGGVYVYLTHRPEYMEAVLAILGAASIAYNFLIKDVVESGKLIFDQEG